MMSIICWFIYRRWRFIEWTREKTFSQRVLLTHNAWKINLCNCQRYPVIHKDMKKILGQ